LNGLAIVLISIEVKILLIKLFKIPVGFLLTVVAATIGRSVWVSLRKEKQ